MIKKNFAAAILWATMLVFRAHASEPTVPTFEPFPDDIQKVIVDQMDPDVLHRVAFLSKGSTVLVKNELQKRLSPLIKSLSKLPAEYDVSRDYYHKGWYETIEREAPDTNEPGAWDPTLFQAKFNQLFLLKEMGLFNRFDHSPEFQELLAYAKPMLTVAVLAPNFEECLYLGIQGAYILSTKPQTVLCPTIDAFYVENKEHQKTYLNPKIAKIIEYVCLNALSKTGTLDLLFDMCNGIIATSKMTQDPLNLTINTVRETGLILNKITHPVHYPQTAYLSFLDAIISCRIKVFNKNGVRCVKMGDHKPRTGDEKRADFDLLRVVCSYYNVGLKFDMNQNIKNSKGLNLMDYDAAIYDDKEALRFKESTILEEFFDD